MSKESLLNYLSEEDKDLFKNYVTEYGFPNEKYCGNETYLRCWDANKQELFRLLGNRLTYELPINLELDTEVLTSIFNSCGLCDHDLVYFLKTLVNDFVKNFVEEVDRSNTLHKLQSLLSIYNYAETFIKDSIEHRGFKCKLINSKTLQVPDNMKPLRAIQKIASVISELMPSKEELKDRYQYTLKEIPHYMQDFQKLHSLFLNTKSIKGILCLSIHPMDFVTMSDNASDWSSCMNWMRQGCFRVGTVEMMNSAYVLCTYIKSENKKFYFTDNEDSTREWNNKKWRQLFYITPDIIVGGKSYPYGNSNLTKLIIEKLSLLAEENLNRTYGSETVEYEDMKLEPSAFLAHFTGEEKCLDDFIFFHTNIMYNDMLADRKRTYYCRRNTVNETKLINISGETVCGCCGNLNCLGGAKNFLDWEYTDYYEDEDLYNERYEDTKSLVCERCNDEIICQLCLRNINRKKLIAGERYTGYSKEKFHICPACAKKTVIKCPCCNKNNVYIPLHGYGTYVFPVIALTQSGRNANSVSITDTTLADYLKHFPKNFDVCKMGERNNAIFAIMCWECLDNQIAAEDGLFEKNSEEKFFIHTKKTYSVDEILSHPLLSKLCPYNALKPQDN